MRISPREEISNLKPYEAGRPIDEVKRELGLEEVAKLASNENPWGPSPKAIEALKKGLAGVNRYPDGGCFHLRRLLSKRLDISEEGIIFGNGSDEIIEIIAKTYLGKEDEVVISEWAFVRFEMAANLMGAKILNVKMKNFTHDLEAMVNAITPKTKLIFIANPNNPTGTMNTKEEFDLFMDRVPPNVMVVVDEAYYEYIDSKDYPETLPKVKEGRDIIILRTFSKIYGLAGIRIGYGISRPQIIQEMERVRAPFNVNSLAQIAAASALEDEEWVARCRRLNGDGKRYLYRELDRLGINYIPSSTNFILIDTGEDDRSVFERLLKEGVITRPMGGYGLKGFIRVSVGRPNENELFIRAFEKIRREI